MENPMWCNPPPPKVQADLLARMNTVVPGIIGQDGRPTPNFAELWLKFLEGNADARFRAIRAERMPKAQGLLQEIEDLTKRRDAYLKKKAELESNVAKSKEARLETRKGIITRKSNILPMAMEKCVDTYLRLRGK